MTHFPSVAQPTPKIPKTTAASNPTLSHTDIFESIITPESRQKPKRSLSGKRETCRQKHNPYAQPNGFDKSSTPHSTIKPKKSKTRVIWRSFLRV